MKEDKDLDSLYDDIRLLIEESKKRIYQAVNTELLNLYWNIGKRINEMQEGEKRAKYASKLLEQLSKKLTEEFGRGFSIRNLRQMRLFYNCFSIRQTLSAQLSWSHYLELVNIVDKNKRNFYMNECINGGWDVRTLKRQKKSLLYERIMLNSDKEKKIYYP